MMGIVAAAKPIVRCLPLLYFALPCYWQEAHHAVPSLTLLYFATMQVKHYIAISSASCVVF
jgi:hypothetical protein